MIGTILSSESRGGRQWAEVELDFGTIKLRIWLPVPDHHYAFPGALWEVGLVNSIDDRYFLTKEQAT